MFFGVVAKTYKKRLLAAAAVMLSAVIAGGILTAFVLSANKEITIGKTTVSREIGSVADAAAVMHELGAVVPESSIIVRNVTIPEEFDDVYSAYNELQKECGLDLYPCRGREALLYCGRVCAASGNDAYVMTLVVCGNRLVGGDISDEKAGGNTHSLGVLDEYI